jgi:DNA helicase-2/ATP-dependent DNA helicase PcrA
MPTTPEFLTAYARLNAEQKAAVDAIDGPVFVIAGPGTGKTQVLTLRIAQILQQTDTPPETIMALTFTDAGATEMRERLTRFIGSRAAKVRFHTFHGFAESLVNRYPDHFARIVGSQVAIDAERAEIMDHALKTANVEYLRPFGDPLYYHFAAKGAIQTLKRENVTPEVLAEKIAEAETEFENIPDKHHTKGKYEGKLKGDYEGLQKKIAKTRDLLAVYNLYEAGLTEMKRYDYEDLILEAVRALTEDEGFRREVQEGLLYVLADEHQDANRAQNAILELLVEYSDRPNLFIVGDEKQAIYRFQGADLDNVQYFRGRFEGTQVIVLKENYRSTQTILDTALSLISASPDERLSRLPLSSQGTDKEGNTLPAKPLSVISFPNQQAEVSYLAEEIQRLTKPAADGGGDVKHEDIAILARRNRDVLWLGEQLIKRQIPVTMGTEDALHNRYVAALIRFLTLINEQRDENLAGSLSLPGFGISAADAWRITRAARTEKVPALTILGSEQLLADAKVSNIEEAKKLSEELATLGRKAAIERPAIVAELALGASGLLGAILAAPDRAESLAAIRAFLTMLEDLSEREHDALLPRALELVALYEERGLQLRSAAQSVVGRVKLMTVHGSKGREFRYVFMPRLTEGAWSTRARPEHFYVPGILSGANELEDERRLFYVGITRAREHAVLSYSTSRDDGKPENATPLLEDLDPALLEKITNTEPGEDALTLPALPEREAGAPSVGDLNTLREAFFAQGLSPTAFNNYLECPWKYFYVNLLRIPEAENKFMLYGTAVHAALKAYADRRTRGEEMGVPYLMSTFSRVLSRSPLTTADIDELMKKGEKSLNTWWQEKSFTWPEKAEAELPIEVLFPLEGKEFTGMTTEGAEGTSPQLKLRGSLDRVDTLPGGSVRVIDYKTGKAKSRNDIMGNTASSDGNYYRQLSFYKLLLARAAQPRVASEGVIEFVEPDESGHIRTESFEISDQDVKDLEVSITKAAHEILSLSFWNTPCEEKDCKWCTYRFGLAVNT